MKIFWLLSLLIFLQFLSIESSLINDFFTGARNLWPVRKDVSSMNQLQDFPSIQFEIPKESDEFLKEGLEIINAPKEAFDLCTNRVVMMLKKNCNQLSLDEIGKLAVMLMNCQLEAEGRSIYPCKPEMTLAQCTMGFDTSIYQLYNIVLHRTLSICSALKQQQFRMFTELAVNRLMQVAQKQTNSIHEALQNQKRINEMGIQNIQEYRDNFEKIKETQIQNMEYLSSAKDQIIELNSDLHRQLEIHQMSEQKLMSIEKSAEEIARQLDSTNEKIVQHYNEAIQFMEHFKNIMQMIAVVTSTIEQVFLKIKEIMEETGIEINQDIVIALILNLIYFTCAMIFIIFVNFERKYKHILIILFIFNNVAAFYQSDVPILATNILVWISFFFYYVLKILKEKIGTWNIKSFRFIKFTDESDGESSPNRRSVSRARSKTPTSKMSNANKNSVKESKSKLTAVDEDEELANLCEQELMNIQNNIPQQTTITVAARPETPSNRPMTPAMMRVLKTDGIDPNRSVTPFQPGLQGRIQCQSITNKGTQCRNAALIGISKCRVHNYD